MPKRVIQVRNVPEELHRRIKARAARAGMSLSEYLLQEIRRMAEQPTVEKLWDRIGRRRPAELSINPAELIRDERASR